MVVPACTVKLTATANLLVTLSKLFLNIGPIWKSVPESLDTIRPSDLQWDLRIGRILESNRESLDTRDFGCRFYRAGWTAGCKFEFLYGFGLSAGSKIHFGGVSRKWISKSADSGIGQFGHDKRGRILKLDGLSKVWTRSRTHAVPILKSAKVWTRLMFSPPRVVGYDGDPGG